jgi:hypothetical protein
MRDRTILTDVDGVLLYWLAGFEKFMAFNNYDLIPNTESSYSIAERYNVTFDEGLELIRKFNKSRHIAGLPAYLDAVEHVGKLSKHGFRFVVITSLSNHPDAKKYRTQNLIDVFGDVFYDVVCLDMGEPKNNALAEWKGKDLFWIEDHIKNAEAGLEHGLRPVLIKQAHNAHYDTDKFPIVGPVNPWKEIYEMICKDYNLVV